MRRALFDPLYGADRVAERLDDTGWVAALLAVEVALTGELVDRVLAAREVAP